MAGGRLIETAPARDIFLAPKTEFAARFFGAGQVLPCEIMGKSPNGVEVSSPIGVFAVPSPQEHDPSRPLLLVPHDALSLDAPSAPPGKSFSAGCSGAVFEGSKLTVKLHLGEIPIEVIAPPRTTPPAPGSRVRVWVDERLLKFVKPDKI
jgi:ABC-type Fe3+/spermidine/putrescine transport system ATPase subunit